ncbi:nucleotidyltransferase domain-containing protein [Catenovulum adriaticum]|uniref:Cyclic GMP-AMP synthase n=1 Tax=Catenovulum adriaticum TaxID=2984846 RepID=A0ABY7AIV9_9ALTE|nr:nucleotidyltransferase [Catenovulum sp. TS8]WAJ69528.1 nucleotidyltransferase [Catenovulum sp. TS8]
MSLQNKYSTFHSNISLNYYSSEYKEAKNKDELILSKIKEEFKDRYTILRTPQLGSMKANTAIRPLNGGDYDIDRGIVLDNDSAPENPVIVKKQIKEVLSKHGFKEPKIKKPCVTADYKSKPIHIDYVVFTDDFTKQTKLGVGKEFSGESERFWDYNDTEGLLEWLVWKGEFKSDDYKKQYYRIVRYLKRWRDYNYKVESERKKVFSIALAVMAREQFQSDIDVNSGACDDHNCLINTLKSMLGDYKYFKPQGEGKYNIDVNLPKVPHIESPRVCQRLNNLRNWNNEKIKSLYIRIS